MPQFTATFVVVPVGSISNRLDPSAGKYELNRHIKEMTGHGWELVSTSACGPYNDVVYLFWRYDAPAAQRA